MPPAQARIINAPPGERTAALSDRATDATAPPAVAEAAASSRFRWPARGRVIASFGKRPDGTHNDGINIAVPHGTDVHAAEGGRVAYAGSELKGYGNLVLIRHDNGWVSAYAHADQILVKRDDVVRRGQVIAKAGKTGTVDQPQLHFELRQGAKPVDPMPHMER
jgi:murein DD-endopeptidase MepM/ murein hydrolase activator NlpD